MTQKATYGRPAGQRGRRQSFQSAPTTALRQIIIAAPALGGYAHFLEELHFGRASRAVSSGRMCTAMPHQSFWVHLLCRSVSEVFAK